jgi:hypothetical protein
VAGGVVVTAFYGFLQQFKICPKIFLNYNYNLHKPSVLLNDFGHLITCKLRNKDRLKQKKDVNTMSAKW